jgi:hypothetical protein
MRAFRDSYRAHCKSVTWTIGRVSDFGQAIAIAINKTAIVRCAYLGLDSLSTFEQPRESTDSTPRFNTHKNKTFQLAEENYEWFRPVPLNRFLLEEARNSIGSRVCRVER